MNVNCTYCKQELGAPVMTSTECGHSFHELCFKDLIHSEFPICDECYAPVKMGVENPELEEMIDRVNSVAKPWEEEESSSVVGQFSSFEMEESVKRERSDGEEVLPFEDVKRYKACSSSENEEVEEVEEEEELPDEMEESEQPEAEKGSFCAIM